MSSGITLEGAILVIVVGMLVCLLVIFIGKSPYSNEHDVDEGDEIIGMTKRTHLTLSNSEWYVLERRAERDRMRRDEYLAWLVSRHLDGNSVETDENESD